MALSPVVVRVAGIEFRLAGAFTGFLPPFDAVPVSLLDRDVVHAVWEAGICYLLVDHRTAPGRDFPARVELWVPQGRGEAPVGGLFVIAASRLRGCPTPAPASLAALARLVLDRAGAPLAGTSLHFDAGPGK